MYLTFAERTYVAPIETRKWWYKTTEHAYWTNKTAGWINLINATAYSTNLDGTYLSNLHETAWIYCYIQLNLKPNFPTADYELTFTECAYVPNMTL